MNNIINDLNVLSCVIYGYYNEIRNLVYSDMEYSVEYYTFIDRLKKLINIENEYYNSIDLHKIYELFDTYYDMFAKDKDAIYPFQSRIIDKIVDKLKKYEGEPIFGDVLLCDAINSKIIIDSIKITNEYIDNLSYSDFNEKLYKYHNFSKYFLLTGNNYIESISLNNNFEIDKLPNIDFKDLENKYNINFINDSMPVFKNDILESIDYITSDVSDDYSISTYLKICETSKIFVLLNYVSKNNLIEILEYLDNYEYDDTAKELKKIIKMKKDGLK